MKVTTKPGAAGGGRGREVILLAAVFAAQALMLEKISEPTPFDSSGWAWRDATHVTWIVPDGPGPEAPATLWELDAVSGTRAKLLEPATVKDRGSPRFRSWTSRR